MKCLLFCVLAVAVALVHADGKGNISCGKLNAFQSTTGTWGGIVADARLAIDGNKNQNWFKGSCTHTDPFDTDPWLSIDLGCRKTVSSVTIWNRVDCCGARLNNFEIVLTDDPYCQRSRCYGHVCAFHEGALGATKTIACSGKGRFLTFRYRNPEQQPAAQRYIHICEVNVNAS